MVGRFISNAYQYYRHTCLLKFILLVLIFVSFTLAHLYFTRATFHFINDRDLLERIQCPKINQTRIEYGRKHLSKSRVIICGLIRDRRAHIKRLREQLSAITNLFADYAIVIVENDSKDGTREELIKWASLDPHIHVIGCANQTTNTLTCNLSLPATTNRRRPETKRIEKMVRLRNMYLNYIEQHQSLNQFDYLLVEDFDLTSYTYLNGLFSTAFHLDHDRTIQAICSNGILYNGYFRNMISYETYFDPYAHKDEQNQNWTVKYNDLWSSFFRQYSCQENLIPVRSCFSGRTIYRYRTIRKKRYQTYLDQHGQAICEHVGFHQTLEKIYLNSEMIFYIFENNLIEK